MIKNPRQRFRSYFCNHNDSTDEFLKAFWRTPVDRDLFFAFNRYELLIPNVSSSFAENFMSVMCKMISGKISLEICPKMHEEIKENELRKTEG